MTVEPAVVADLEHIVGAEHTSTLPRPGRR